MTHPQPPSSGPAGSANPAAEDPSPAGADPRTTADPAPEVPISSAFPLPDRDPFTETDLLPEIEGWPGAVPARPRGFSAFITPAPGESAGASGRPSATPTAPPARDSTGSPSTFGAGYSTTPGVAASASTNASAPGAASAAGVGGSTARTAPAPSNLNLARTAVRSKAPLIALGSLTGALLLVCGVLVGVLWASGGSDGSEEVAAPATADSTATTERTTTSRVTTTRAPATTRAPSSSTVPTTASSASPTTDVGVAPTSGAPIELVADFTWTPDPARAGQTVTISDRSTGGATRWVWTWNGNVVSSSQPKGFTTSLRQDTPITLTVCGADGACASATKVVTVG